MRLVRAILIGALLIWVCALPVAASIRSSSIYSPISAVIYLVGSFICHQRPDRSFQLAGAAWPVCARCTGIYGGAALGVVSAIWFSRPTSWAVLVGRARVGLALAALPTACTLLVEWTLGVPVSNAWRAASGIPLGAAIGWVLTLASDPALSVEVH